MNVKTVERAELKHLEERAVLEVFSRLDHMFLVRARPHTLLVARMTHELKLMNVCSIYTRGRCGHTTIISPQLLASRGTKQTDGQLKSTVRST